MLQTQLSITEILETAAAIVRNCEAARELALDVDDEDEGIDCALINFDALDGLNVCLVADKSADVLGDVVCVDVAPDCNHAAISLVTKDGKCLSPEIVSRNEIVKFFLEVDTNIALPHTRDPVGRRVFVFAGRAAQQLAIAAGGLGRFRPVESTTVWMQDD